MIYDVEKYVYGRKWQWSNRSGWDSRRIIVCRFRVTLFIIILFVRNKHLTPTIRIIPQHVVYDLFVCTSLIVLESCRFCCTQSEDDHLRLPRRKSYLPFYSSCYSRSRIMTFMERTRVTRRVTVLWSTSSATSRRRIARVPPRCVVSSKWRSYITCVECEYEALPLLSEYRCIKLLRTCIRAPLKIDQRDSRNTHMCTETSKIVLHTVAYGLFRAKRSLVVNRTQFANENPLS